MMFVNLLLATIALLLFPVTALIIRRNRIKWLKQNLQAENLLQELIKDLILDRKASAILFKDKKPIDQLITALARIANNGYGREGMQFCVRFSASSMGYLSFWVEIYFNGLSCRLEQYTIDLNDLLFDPIKQPIAKAAFFQALLSVVEEEYEKAFDEG